MRLTKDKVDIFRFLDLTVVISMEKSSCVYDRIPNEFSSGLFIADAAAERIIPAVMIIPPANGYLGNFIMSLFSQV